MKRIGWTQLFLLFLLSIFVKADTNVILPKEGSVFSAESGKASVTLGWTIDDVIYPLPDDITVYNVTICSGPQSGFKCMFNLANDVLSKQVRKNDKDEYLLDLEIKADEIWDGQFFIQLTAKAGDMGYSIHYSPRFFLKSMNQPKKDASSYSGKPWGEIHITQDKQGKPFNPTTLYIATPYTAQTATVRWAPIQTQPGTKVTATTWSMRHPTSSVSYYSTLQTNISALLQFSTITIPRTDSFTSVINHITPAPMPTENGGWYDPKKRQSLSTKKVNLSELA